MIYIVLGQSGSGKTTFCKSEIILPPYESQDDIVPITIGKNGVKAIGRYGVGKRCEGTDTLPYNAQKKIIEEVEKLANEGADILLEGDRITSKAVMEALLKLRQPKKMYITTCSIGTSMRRLRAAGSKITPTFVKATKTKARRLFMEYGTLFSGEVINTEEA